MGAAPLREGGRRGLRRQGRAARRRRGRAGLSASRGTRAGPGNGAAAGADRRARRARLARALLLLALVVAAVGILLPASWLGELRELFPWLSRAISRLTRAAPHGIDLIHALLFAVIGAMTALAFPRRSVGWLSGALLLLAAASEIAQFWIPGRTPSVAEFAVDVGAGVGMLGGVRLLQRGRA